MGKSNTFNWGKGKVRSEKSEKHLVRLKIRSEKFFDVEERNNHLKICWYCEKYFYCFFYRINFWRTLLWKYCKFLFIFVYQDRDF